MRFRIALLTATVVAAPLALMHTAKAQPVTGFYVGGEGGVNWESKTKDEHINVNGMHIQGSAKNSYLIGPEAEASVGYGFGNGFRVEVEGDWTENRFKNITSSLAGGKAAGDEQKYGVMVNALYDFDVGLPYLFPYVGAGAGWQRIHMDNFGGTFYGDNLNVDKHANAFAYQAIAGIAVPLPPVPGLSFTVEYRFMGLTGTHHYWGSYGPANTPVGFKMGNEFNHSVLAGLRYAFGVTPPPPSPAPAPAPVAAPAPAPAKTYLVFFDWDKYNLTPRAMDIISQAASDSRTQQTTQILCNGYTDTSGTAKYNMGLSWRRAKAVAAQLVADGVPASEITMHGYGETHLLVPTGPGVREPQNRRVEIVLQ